MYLIFKFCLSHIADILNFNLFLADPASYSGGLFGALEILSKRLRLLDEIPLKISSVQALDPGSILYLITSKGYFVSFHLLWFSLIIFSGSFLHIMIHRK